VKLTMVVPIYNETECLPIFLELLDEIDLDSIHFLVVDNGSTDPKVKSILESGSRSWSAIRTEKNLGFGGGILFGVEACKTPFVGWMPGNLKVDPREFARIVGKYELNENQMVKSYRVGRSFSARVKTQLLGLVQSMALGTNMTDSGGTPTVCEKRFLLSLANPPTDYVFESYVLFYARKKGLEIKRPKVTYGVRAFGQSHWQRGLRSEVNLFVNIWKQSKKWR
jgi:glycosyltransferase involved in cell wall biosynthesis